MKRKRPVFSGTISCQCCGKETPKTGAMQKFCEDCSRLKELERKKKWAKKNPVNADISKVHHEAAKSRNVERGLTINKDCVENISHFPDVDLQWLIKIAIPFTYVASKNHLWSTNRKGHVYRRAESNELQNEIILELKRIIFESGQKIYRNKIWLDIFVQKPDHKGDAINVLDLIADAVKEAVGIDDRWFSVRRIDWQIVKQNPRIFIGLGQQDLFDAKLCSYCGRILPEENFGKSRRECQECTSQKKFLKKDGRTNNR